MRRKAFFYSSLVAYTSRTLLKMVAFTFFRSRLNFMLGLSCPCLWRLDTKGQNPIVNLWGPRRKWGPFTWRWWSGSHFSICFMVVVLEFADAELTTSTARHISTSVCLRLHFVPVARRVIIRSLVLSSFCIFI
jgi:hypothetical protein